MNKNKIFSVFTSFMMCFCVILSGFPVSAASTESNDKKYTLEELFAMSKEEFFALESNDLKNGEFLYDMLEEYTLELLEYNQKVNKEDRMYLSASFILPISSKDENAIYTANITEMEIEKLVGNAAKCEIESPIFNDDVVYYPNLFAVTFPEYESLEETTIFPEEKALEIVKCWFCVNQVIDMGYNSPLLNYSSGTDEKVLNGDVNFDKMVDLYDVIWIASDLVDIFKLTEGQQKVGDVNKDGVCDLYDAIAIAETLM